MALLGDPVTLLEDPATLPKEDDHTAGRDIYDGHETAWKKLRFTDPDNPTDPKPAEKLYNFIDGDSGNTLLGAGTDRDDVYRAGHGSDYFQAKKGNDHLFGQTGNDSLYGNEGNDQIYGGDSADFPHGNEGDDTLWGDGGADALWGDQGADTLHGGDLHDIIHGGPDRDTLYGEADGDFLYGEEGDDTLFGGPGNDHLEGGPGDDSHDGGEGGDAFWFRTGDGHDRILGFEPKVDRIVVDGVAETQIRYSSDASGTSTVVTWGDPAAGVVLVGVPADAFA
jgi:Ca2+-binding RTX toxin-like protein